jgi:hypothetical protein
MPHSSTPFQRFLARSVAYLAECQAATIETMPGRLSIVSRAAELRAGRICLAATRSFIKHSVSMRGAMDRMGEAARYLEPMLGSEASAVRVFPEVAVASDPQADPGVIAHIDALASMALAIGDAFHAYPRKRFSGNELRRREMILVKALAACRLREFPIVGLDRDTEILLADAGKRLSRCLGAQAESAVPSPETSLP